MIVGLLLILLLFFPVITAFDFDFGPGSQGPTSIGGV